jgi:hypothetical protein
MDLSLGGKFVLRVSVQKSASPVAALNIPRLLEEVNGAISNRLFHILE